MLLRHHLIKGAGVERKNRLDRARVFDSRNGVGFVMIHVAGGDDQNLPLLRRNHISNRIPELRKDLELSGSKRDRNESEIRPPDQQKWQLNFSGVLTAVRGRILLQQRAALFERGRE